MAKDNNLFLAPAKINLFLHVVGRRDDNYHLLQSVFCLIDICDQIWIDVRNDGKIFRSLSNLDIPEQEDLTIKAATSLKNYCLDNPPAMFSNNQINVLGANIKIKKNIPVGAGLGGGSSNAATTLLALNYLWHLNLPNNVLQKIATSLGADVAFFVGGKNAMVQGIGEKITEINLHQHHSSPKVAILVPPINISTANVFKDAHLITYSPEAKPQDVFKEITKTLPFSQPKWKNDLQPVAELKYPNMLDYHNQFADAIANGDKLSIRMSGSGSSYFYFFSEKSLNCQDYQNNLGYNFQLLFRKSFFRIVDILPKHPLIGIDNRKTIGE